MNKKQSTFRVLALVAVLGALHGCGGGGGDNDAPPATPQTPSTPTTPETPSQTPTTPTAPDTPPAPPSTPATPTGPDTPPAPTTPATPPSNPYAPVAGSEPGPALSQPDPGSTAAVGSAWEGIYESTSGYTFITPSGTLFRKDLVQWIRGSISVSGTNWTFNSDTSALFITTQPVTGSGTFTPQTSMDGTYSTNGGTPVAWGPLTYSLANALAITPASLQGTWSASGMYAMSFDVDANGGFSGATSGAQLGVCQLSGSMVQVTPGSAKNMFTLTMTAVNAATGSDSPCRLNTASSYAGLAAIVLTPAGRYQQNGYFRTIAFNAITGDGASLFSGYLTKEQ